MNIEFIPKKHPILTFGDLSNADVFQFRNEGADHFFWMKVGNFAMRLGSGDVVIPVQDSLPVDLYPSCITIQGK